MDEPELLERGCKALLRLKVLLYVRQRKVLFAHLDLDAALSLRPFILKLCLPC